MGSYIPNTLNTSLRIKESGGPNGTRPRVFGVGGRCARSIDDGTAT